MKVYSLTGKSGTGKSYRAISLSQELNIEAIIDDGLFIYRNVIAAGVSAKRQDTKMGAIKTALFLDEKERDDIKRAISDKNPSSILVLATSEKMALKIAEALSLGDIPEGNRIKIEDITTEEEREEANKERNILGKHVIPAPSLQLKRSFAGYFMDSLRQFRGKESMNERTVVRPSFSYLGEYVISQNAINDMIKCTAKSHPEIFKIIHISHQARQEAYKLKIMLKVRFGYELWENLTAFQKDVEKNIEKMTAFNIVEVRIDVKGIEE